MGHTETLHGSPPWAALLAHAREQECLFIAVPPYSRILTASRDSLLGKPALGRMSSGDEQQPESPTGVEPHPGKLQRQPGCITAMPCLRHCRRFDRFCRKRLNAAVMDIEQRRRGPNQ